MKLRLILCAFDRHDFGPERTESDGRTYIDCMRCRETRQLLTREYMAQVLHSLNKPWEAK